jgi:hypothetical protein
MLDANTIAHGNVRVVALNPIKSMCQRLVVADGYNPSASLQIWKGTAPWRLVFSIGQPDHHVRLKAKRSER